MSGILRLESLTKGNTLKQGDKTPLKYKLFDADGEKLNIAGKSARVRFVNPDISEFGYEKDELTVAQDDTVTFTIDKPIPPKLYYVEIIVDEKFIFPSRADETKFSIDKSSVGIESNIIEIVGLDSIVERAVDSINSDPSLIIDEDKLLNNVIANTGLNNIDEYYQQFNDVITELSEEKDYHSLPEIAEARQGEGKLSLRLQRDFNRHKKILDDRGVNPLDFGCVADGVTDDTDAFQQVMDYAIANNLPIIVTGAINIAGTLLFRKIYDRRVPLRVEGGGKIVKRNAGYLFSSDVTYDGREVYAGNIRFSNLTFESTEGDGSVLIDPTKVLRAYFNNCDILNFDHLIKSTGDTYAQTIYLNDVVVAGGRGYFIDVPEIYDFSFAHSVCEHRESLVRVTDSYHSMRIIDSVIEGMTGQVANVRWGQNLEISANYFEHNSSETNAPYIEFTFGNTIDSTSAVIGNNHFVATDGQRDNDDYYLIKTRSFQK